MKFSSVLLSSVSLLMLSTPSSNAFGLNVDLMFCPPGGCEPISDEEMEDILDAESYESSSEMYRNMDAFLEMQEALEAGQPLEFSEEEMRIMAGADSEVSETLEDRIQEIEGEHLPLHFNEIQENSRSITINSEEISSLRSKMTSSLTEDIDKSIVVGDSSSTSLKIGTGPNPTTIHEAGLEVGGENLIRRSANGAVHIGKNSLVTIEEGGRQKMWATNSAGESIDIDITNGSKLLINGRDVEKSIDNVGALSAALGSVPAISADSPFTCGFGAGTHSNAYAVSGGCASRVSNRVSVNAAIATVINNGTGDSDDNVSARAGFTFKLGKVDDSPKVAARKAAALHDEVVALRTANTALMARLERLEKIASIDNSVAGDLASRN